MKRKVRLRLHAAAFRRATRRAQRGAVYTGAVDAIAYLVIGGVALVLLLLVAASIVGLAKGRGIVRWVIVPLAIAGWVVPLWDWTNRAATEKQAESEKKARWMAARQMCKGELARLPESVPARGLLDDGRGVLMDGWRGLLGQRDIGFIEFRFRESGNTGRLLVYADGSGAGGSLPIDRPSGSLVRVSLSSDSDPACISDERYGSRAAEWFRTPPFLPDTCVAVTFPAQPEAELALLLSGPDQPTAPFHRWQLVDRATGRILAGLTSSTEYSDDRFVTTYSNEFPSRDPGRRNSCSEPRNVLAGRLVHATNAPASPQVVRMHTVPAQVQPDALAPQRPARVKLQSEVGPSEALSSIDLGADGLPAWQAAVEAAKRNGRAAYGPWTLDWSTREMKRISFDAEQSSYGRWTFQAAHDGYYMWSLWHPGVQKPPMTFAHYRRDGALDWAVRLEPTGEQEDLECSWHNPTQLDAGADEISLVGVGWCGEARERRKLTWTIARRDLPH
ncbi:hypothetical protein [Ideonella sp.]|uniref:hypothetical protein n=1 Tax=Ideonella sp. TaxID=1929293 RepID=UPI002B4A9330|nr:hypothetical protein [Ideonella sp.]HJV70303.1 hypothetical protein [Ideonella sp.]